MAAHRVAGDGQAEADAAGFRVARPLDPVEGSEDLRALFLRDARAVVLDRDFHGLAVALGGNPDMVAMARGMLYDPRFPWHAAEALGVEIDDLYAVTMQSNPNEIVKPDGVHFTDEGSVLLGKVVADFLRD